MTRIRMVEEEIAKRYPSGKMRCPTHLSIGQEAVPCVISSMTGKTDTAVSTHRCHAHYLAKGGNLKKMIAEIHGKKGGCAKGKGGSMHLIDKSCGFMGSSAIVGNSIAIGVGIALSFEQMDKKNLSIVYFGEGATEEGIFYESVNFAVLRKLNVLFVCEDNMYSVYSPLNVRQPEARSLKRLVKNMGMKHSIELDGNDAKTLVNECEPIINEIKEGNGPGLIHCSTYRWREHCGPNYDNDIGYRDEEEFNEWKEKDPIKRLEKILVREVECFERNKKFKIKQLRHEIYDAFKFAEDDDYPDKEEAHKGIYAEG